VRGETCSESQITRATVLVCVRACAHTRTHTNTHI
jgi:hypothetical protein